LKMLIILGGLPGTGKTTIARELARQLGAVHLRIDAIERALQPSWPKGLPLDDAGYQVGYVVAEENLRLGHVVIADSVNPLTITRAAWRSAAERVPASFLEVEVVCSDMDEHRRRVESRNAEMGVELPAWEEVLSREYEAWPAEHLLLDTASLSPDESVTLIRRALDLSGTVINK
jgi:predicted kinase